MDIDVQIPAAVETPAVLVDLAKLTGNIDRMMTRVSARGATLRPHAKTHKCSRIAKMQLAAGAIGLTVATLGEAEVFASEGCDDIFIAYPLFVVGRKRSRLASLHERINLSVGCDSVEAVPALAAAVAGAPKALRVLVEIDSGQHRSGVDPSDAASIARAASDAGLAVTGVFTHGGHVYASRDGVQAAATDECEALRQAATSLHQAGFDIGVVSAGSTPTTSTQAREGITEERPGTYVFHDRQQLAFGAAATDEVALFIATTVVSRTRADQFVLDAGSKILSSDRPLWVEGFGSLPGYPGALIERLSEEHAVVSVRGGGRPSVGDVVAVIPNHACPVVNLTDELIIVSDGRVADTWPVDARRRRPAIVVD